MATTGGVSREGTAKSTVRDQISQAVQSTSNLLHLMQQSSPSRALLVNLPKDLFEKASTIKNTGQVIEKMPRVISSLDAHMENGLQRFRGWVIHIIDLTGTITCRLYTTNLTGSGLQMGCGEKNISDASYSTSKA